jgi:prevent-host-death family protein
MKAVSSTQANREFSKLLREVAHGASVQITSRGRPIATLIPVDARAARRRSAAQADLMARLARQAITGERDWVRDDLYD